ncbi:MetQ/NlpA family lipoprotein [Aquibacillus halophilus]|uniref:Lipoprotein n=1 Tax=Aquibacillus halophilus TaxID=930132 RepID=A0A6A8DE27_9BACI|nr:MetQ/NlpA family ABC transporter substrate-binding protein [Aquibacillus halophilus]MRH42031.1 MetQ/NlpA family lipoprotein [Aquibacillus halophilus]
MKKLLLVICVLVVTLIVSGCGSEEAGALNKDKLIVGVTGGPHEQIIEKVAEVALKDGLEIEIKVFSDFAMPNVALAEGELDLNSFQHTPFFEEFKEDRGLDLVSVGKTIINPMSIYSDKITNIDEIEEGAKIGLPNDPTNGSRAMLIFEDAGLITLKEDLDEEPTVRDIAENKLNLEFIELDAAQLPKQLSELTAAAINTSYAISHGFVPSEDAIFMESSDSPYANLIAARPENKDEEVVAKFVNAYQSDEVKEFIETEFKGSIIPTW